MNVYEYMDVWIYLFIYRHISCIIYTAKILRFYEKL